MSTVPATSVQPPSATSTWPLTSRACRDPHVLDKIGARNPRGVVGSAAEAAEVLVWLVSRQARLVNGQVLVADGGWTLVAGTVDTARPEKLWYEP